jgi:hypothetical protein
MQYAATKLEALDGDRLKLMDELRRLRLPEDDAEKARLDEIQRNMEDYEWPKDVLGYAQDLVKYSGEMRARATMAHEKYAKQDGVVKAIREEFMKAQGLPIIEKPKGTVSMIVGSLIKMEGVEFTVGQIMFAMGEGPMRFLTVFDLEGKVRIRLVLAAVPVPKKGDKDGVDQAGANLHRTEGEKPEGGGSPVQGGP